MAQLQDRDNQMEPQPSDHDTFQKFKSYSFDTDPEFANGLAIILGHPETPATVEEASCEDDLTLQAKCFYFSRKENLSSPLDFAAYKAWLASDSGMGTSLIGDGNGIRSQQRDISDPAARPSPPEPSTAADSAPSTNVPEPNYPSSFAHIVELITTGQPIPGIQQIPDTVLTGHDTPSTKPRRRKPWETEDDDAQNDSSNAI